MLKTLDRACIAAVFLAVFLLAGCAASKEVTTAAAVPIETRPTTPQSALDEGTAEETGPIEQDSEQILDYWMHLDGDDGAYVGVGTQRAYDTLLKDKAPLKKVVVAVIDSGVDTRHEDLPIWINEDETPGNGVDDDKNGYVDDVNGWNFLGGSDGENIHFDTFEVTREFARLRKTFEAVNPDSLTDDQREEYDYFLEIQEAYNDEVEEMTDIFNNIQQAGNLLDAANSIMEDFLGREDFTIEQVREADSPREEVQQAKSILLYFDQIGLDKEQLMEEQDKFVGYLEKGLNPAFDPREIVGDDYADSAEKYYGNNDVTGPDAYHGTHVAGIISAVRGNGIGVDGIANDVEIMVVRAVPEGDERDKDVANAIRYAVDNGADIINMSFGKSFSPHKKAVDEAVKYAEAHNVLMIHAAGNDGVDTDNTSNYPSAYLLDGEAIGPWIEVGASSWEGPQNLAASFSNFGKQNVDLFAPGVDIYSTAPGNTYEHDDGTSMASPVVAGVAALVMSYYPQFSAAEIKEILLDSAVSYADQMVTKPGTESTMVSFGSLSKTGSIVNAYRALSLAEEMANGLSTQ